MKFGELDLKYEYVLGTLWPIFQLDNCFLLFTAHFLFLYLIAIQEKEKEEAK